MIQPVDPGDGVLDTIKSQTYKFRACIFSQGGASAVDKPF